MELRQIEYLLTVVSCGSVTKASGVLGVAQPAISRQIRQLEEEIGARLLYRHGRGIQATTEGQTFLDRVGPLIRDLRQAKEGLQASAGLPCGDITLAMPTWMCAEIGCQLVQDITRDFPAVRLNIIEGLSGLLNEWLVAGRVDMAVVADARRSPVISMDWLLGSDLYLLGNAAKMRRLVGDADSIPVSALAGVPLIQGSRHLALRRTIDLCAQQQRVDLNIIAEVDSLPVIKQLVHAGVGFSAFPYSAILHEVDDPGFTAVKLVDPVIQMRFMIASAQHRPRTAGMDEVEKTLRQLLKAKMAHAPSVAFTAGTERRATFSAPATRSSVFEAAEALPPALL